MRNGKLWQRGGAASNIVTLAALVLFVITLLTTPFAMSKYYASGSGSASAHIAKWDIACESPVDPTDGSAYIKFRPAEGATESKVYTNKIIITNNSEVMATPAPYVDVIASSGPAGTFTYTLARTDAAAATPVPVGGSATYTLTVTDNQTSTSPQDAMAQIRIKVYAVQVD